MKGALAFAGGKLRDDASLVLVRRAALSPGLSNVEAHAEWKK